MFALQSPLSEGTILADEVGLGKTIEAGIVLCQRWAERKRRLLVICPASIRKQWATELIEKFNLPTVVMDARAYREFQKQGNPRPFEQKLVLVVSYHYAARMRDDLRMVPWDLVVIDEAHKLRNAYRPSNKVGQAIRWATEGRKKLLLTATPLQNSLMELYGLSTLIGEVLELLGIGVGVHPLGGCENGLGSAGPSPRSTPWRRGYRHRCAPVKPSRP